MNGTEPKIEIFAPFGAAFELTKKILFQPFDLQKWCVIGFAAFLANLSGSGISFHVPGGNRWPNHVSMNRGDIRSFIDQIGTGWMIAIGIGMIFFIALIVVLMWVSARGRFIFVDCIVRNRGAIAQPWKEYRREGNSYFIFTLLAALVIITVIITVVLLMLVPALRASSHALSGSLFLPLLCLAVIFTLLFVFAMLMQFVVPMMYRRRSSAWPVFREVLSLFGRNGGPFVLYFLFSIVLSIAALFVIAVATCLTCCIVAVPYVGTVILLPIFVLLRSFSLLFLRQFGPDYDVWAGTTPPELPSPPLSPPDAPPPLLA